MTMNSHPNVERFARFARHIEDLCRAFDVRMTVVPGLPPDEGGAGHRRHDHSQKCIRIAPVIDDTTYAVALHEIGHCVSPLGMMTESEGSATMRLTHNCATLRDVRLQLEEEYAAWGWAHYYALEWNDLMTTVETYAVNTYIADARRLGLKEKLR